MTPTLKVYRQAGSTFSIPDSAEEFVSDVQPVTEEMENGNSEAEKFDRWYESNIQQQLIEHENNI